MREKYIVQLIIDNEKYFEKNYRTYQEIVDDFPIFKNSENVRTWRRMLEKSKIPKYKNSERYRYFKIFKIL